MGRKDKKPILRWKGLMAGRKRLTRVVTAVLLAVACASLTFVQLGFAGIGIDGQFTAYIVVLLLPIALAALLLGTLTGVLMGLIAGGVLYLHAIVMPLDYFELTFVTPITSIALFVVCGLLLGVLFAFALRNNPSQPRRIIYIVIVCLVVSTLYSIGFVVNVFLALITQLVGDYAASGAGSMTDEVQASFTADVVRATFRMGDVGMQILLDASLMALFCGIGDFLAEKSKALEGSAGMRAIFGTWLLIVAALAFMVTGAVSFAAVTEDAKNDADQLMRSEVGYLLVQLDDASQRGESLVDLFESLDLDLANLSEGDFEKLVTALSTNNILKGYTPEEDGSVVVMFPHYEFEGDDVVETGDYLIFASNDERFKPSETLGDYVGNEVMAAIAESIATGKMVRTIDDGKSDAAISLSSDVETISTHISYLYAGQADSYIVFMMQPESMIFEGRFRTMAWITLTSLVLLLVVFVIMFRLLNHVVARRIDETNDVLEKITQGNLDERVDVRDTREFSTLSNGINSTVETLQGWIHEAETRMDAELATAKAIQDSALPRIFPPYPDILRFDIYASMNAAREVGGDFYDFFLIGGDSGPDAGKLGFLIADVSGKGVPAALFMMNAKANVRSYIEAGMELGEAVENANRKLCDENDTGMFVTVWVGVLDYATGHVDFVNAGHNPPLLWQNGSWRWLRERSGLPLGLFDGLPYEAHSLDCAIGDQFLLYTDGVTEAMDVDDRQYGEQRLEELATESYPLHPRELIETVRRSVAEYTVGAEQSDDITILALEVGVPPEITATLTVPANVAELPHVNEFIHTELDRRLCPLRTQNQLDIAVEELFVNVAHYAYPDATPEDPGSVRISYTYSAEPPSITVDIADDGIPYDPLAKPDAVTPDDIMDVPIGGLGILMAKRSVDEMRYERIDGSNVVTIVKKW